MYNGRFLDNDKGKKRAVEPVLHGASTHHPANGWVMNAQCRPASPNDATRLNLTSFYSLAGTPLPARTW